LAILAILAILDIFSPESQIRRRFERRSTDAADHGGTVTAGERVGYFAGAVGTIKRVTGLMR
jgi:hypothetical protein